MDRRSLLDLRGPILGALILGAPGLAPAALGQTVSPPDELFITVEPGGTALFREVRSAQLVEGDNRLRAFETSPRILPGTVHLRSLTQPSAVRLARQTLWFEVLDTRRILEQLVGQEIDLRVQRQWTTEELEGRLLLPPYAAGPQGERNTPIYLESSDGEIRVLDGAELVLDTLPDGAWNRVRLDWLLRSTQAGRHQLELDYRSEGLYLELSGTLRIDESGERGDLIYLASVRNDTGVSFEGVRLQFAVPSTLPRANRHQGEREPDFCYPLAEEVRLEARRTQQFTLAHTVSHPLGKVFAVFPDGHPAAAPAPGSDLVPVVQRYDLTMDTAEGLPNALPAAWVEIYRLDEDRRLHRESRSPAPEVGRGEVLFFAGPPLPGLAVRRTLSSQSSGREVSLSFFNERPEAVRLEVMQELGLREVARSVEARVDLSRPGWAMVQVDVPAGQIMNLSYTVTRE